MRTRLQRFSSISVLFLTIVLIAPTAAAVGSDSLSDADSHETNNGGPGACAVAPPVIGAPSAGGGAGLSPLWLPPGGVVRLAGPDRFATSVAISQEFYAPGVDAVYIARGDAFPDGLAAGPPAGREVAGPILLTEKDALPVEVADELARLQPKQIFILGGSAVVSESIAWQISVYTTGSVTRLAGLNRYETAASVSSRFYSSIYNGNYAVCIARGDAFPDALAGGPLCSTQRGPILLTPSDALPEVVTHEIDSLQLTSTGTFYILGGEAAISPAIEQWLVNYVNPGADHDPRVVRLSGEDRFETAAEIYMRRAGCWAKVAFIATGRNFPDALAGGAPSARLDAPILLVDTTHIPPSTAAALTDLKPATIYILGGENTVSTQIADALQTFIVP